MSRADAIDGIAHAVARRLADPAFLDLIADAVAEHGFSPKLVDAAEIARRFGLERSTVYALAQRGALPALKVGDGPRPRWRFDPEQVAEALAAKPPEKPSRPRRHKERRDVDLLPIRHTEEQDK